MKAWQNMQLEMPLFSVFLFPLGVILVLAYTRRGGGGG